MKTWRDRKRGRGNRTIVSTQKKRALITGGCRYPEAPSSLNESFVAPPPGEVVGGWLTLLEVSLSCHGPSCRRSLNFWNHPSTETDHCRSPRAWPSGSNVGPFARAILAPGLFVCGWLSPPSCLGQFTFSLCPISLPSSPFHTSSSLDSP